MNNPEGIQQKPKLLDQVRNVIQMRIASGQRYRFFCCPDDCARWQG